MDSLTIVLIVGGLMVVLMLMAQPIAFVMATIGLLGMYWLMGGKAPSATGLLVWGSANSYMLTAVPLFLFMGELLLRSKMAAGLYSGLTPIVSYVPGRLLHANIATCAIFSAISGSSIATAATIGTVALPELEKRGYHIGMNVGSLAAGGTLGILIPPSLIMIIYASLVGESVGQLFMGGVIPGIILTLLYMSYIGVRALAQPAIAPRQETKNSWKNTLYGLFHMGPVALLIFSVLGTIYLGIATPTEAAALGGAGAVVILAAYRRLNWQVVKESARAAGQTSSMVLFILAGATLLNYVIANLDVPRQVVAYVTELNLSPMLILTNLCVVYIILGCFIDGVSMMVLTLPVVYPIITSLGFNSVWFGIVLVILIEIGQVTPPHGINLFVIQGIAPHISFGTIVRGVSGFILMQGVALALVIMFPELVLWLPSLMITAR